MGRDPQAWPSPPRGAARDDPPFLGRWSGGPLQCWTYGRAATIAWSDPARSLYGILTGRGGLARLARTWSALNRGETLPPTPASSSIVASMTAPLHRTPPAAPARRVQPSRSWWARR